MILKYKENYEELKSEVEESEKEVKEIKEQIDSSNSTNEFVENELTGTINSGSSNVSVV